MYSEFLSFYRGVISLGNFLQSFFLLCVRLFWGWHFFKAGFDKFNDIPMVTNFFESLHIPAPLLNTYLVASIETVGGLLLMLGLASRLITLPLMFTMLIALLTAHYKAIIGIFYEPLTVVTELPFTFLFAALIVFCFGPGIFSLDALIEKMFKKEVKQ